MFFSLSAQITQEQADTIAIERMSSVMKLYTIYAMDDVQTSFEVITAANEKLELDYPCWVCYVNFLEETNGKYLIVKENNGNILEINARNDNGPNDLTTWRIVTFEPEPEYPIDIPFTVYSLSGTSCQWINLNYDEQVIIINSTEELENYISCHEGTCPAIDFSQSTLLVANGTANHDVFNIIIKNIQQLSRNEYELNTEIRLYDTGNNAEWTIALIVRKMNGESMIDLNRTYIIQENVYHYPTITLDKTWNVEHGMACPEGDNCFCYLHTTTIEVGNVRIFNEKEYYELLGDFPLTHGVVYVREENNQVFFYAEDCDKEYLLYDYNLKVGDGICIVDPLYPYSISNQTCELTEFEMEYLYKYKVTDIDVVEYNGVKRKRLRLENYHGHYPYGYWVEGIGCMRGITYQISSQLMGGVQQLKDCYALDELIFENENPQYIWCP